MSSEEVSLKAPAMEAKDGFMPQENVPVTQSDINAFEHEAPVVMVETEGTSQLSNLPKASLDDSLQRWVKVKTQTLTTADSGLTYLGDFWSNFLGNAFVRDKTKNFDLIRATLHVTAVVTAPAGTFGMYCIFAHPGRGAANNQSYGGNLANLRMASQLDHFAIVNIANANTFEFQLPFLWPDDYGQPNPTTNFAEMWDHWLGCYTPLTATNGTTTPTGTIQFYARLGDDVELIVPTYV